MTDYKIKLLVDLEVRIKQILLLCDSLKDENSGLKSELTSKQKRIVDLEKNLHQLKTRYDSLKTVRTITAASVDVETSKLKLSKLVREVDKCINLLK
mgnify:CR=1 FL=1